jgi:hypothetical protein
MSFIGNSRKRKEQSPIIILVSFLRLSIFIFLLLSVLFFTKEQEAAARSPIYLGVSDTGDIEDYNSFQEDLNRPLPLMQTFHTFGTSLKRASLRWQETGARPVLHISLNNEAGGAALHSLREVARGKSDDYLVSLNSDIRQWKKSIVVRPIGEPNRPLNSYSAFLPNGKKRGASYSPRQYRLAFRRIAIVLRGGTRAAINRRLAAQKLPPLRDNITSGVDIGSTRVKIAWSPLPTSLGIRGNEPKRFHPGRRFYDIVGTSFFSAWSKRKPLDRFYRKFKGKPFYLLEWGLNSDDPRFVRQVYRWCYQKKRCRAMIYYQGFSEMSYRLDNFLKSKRVIRLLSSNLLRYPISW